MKKNVLFVLALACCLLLASCTTNPSVQTTTTTPATTTTTPVATTTTPKVTTTTPVATTTPKVTTTAPPATTTTTAPPVTTTTTSSEPLEPIVKETLDFAFASAMQMELDDLCEELGITMADLDDTYAFRGIYLRRQPILFEGIELREFYLYDLTLNVSFAAGYCCMAEYDAVNETMAVMFDGLKETLGEPNAADVGYQDTIKDTTDFMKAKKDVGAGWLGEKENSLIHFKLNIQNYQHREKALIEVRYYDYNPLKAMEEKLKGER